MSLSPRTLIRFLAAVLFGTGIVVAVGAAGYAAYGVIAIVIAVAVVLIPALPGLRQPHRSVDEPAQIEELDEDRRNELIRGTSMHLRDMKYRYSLRYDRSDRTPFTAEVNTVILGFVPVIILDNHTDKQGYGFVAFPYDGRRWRGPGLPCGGDPDQALAHAARCVAPLDEDVDTDETAEEQE